MGCLRGERWQPLLAEDMASRCRSPRLGRSSVVRLVEQGDWGCLSTGDEGASALVPSCMRKRPRAGRPARWDGRRHCDLGRFSDLLVLPCLGSARAVHRQGKARWHPAIGTLPQGRGFPSAGDFWIAEPVDREERPLLSGRSRVSCPILPRGGQPFPSPTAFRDGREKATSGSPASRRTRTRGSATSARDGCVRASVV